MDTSYKTTLELDKIIARAVQLCACRETKEKMQALEAYMTPEEERFALSQTDAINGLLIKNGSPRFGSVSDVRRITAHAQKGGILSMGELLEIAATLRNFAGLSQWYGLSDHDMLPTDDLFYALAPQPVLEKQIGESILSPEEMADTASMTLHDLRRKIRQTEDSIRTKLDNIIKNSTTNKFLQDAVVSLRNGRYVVPVRAEYRGEVGGRYSRCFLHGCNDFCGTHRSGGSQCTDHAVACTGTRGNHSDSFRVFGAGWIFGAAVFLQLRRYAANRLVVG